MPAGRPRTVSLEPDEMIELGKEMVQWCITNKPLHLSQWWSVEKDFSDSDWNAMRHAPEFLHYYAKSLRIVGYSYIDKDSSVDVRIKDRWQRVYFKDLRDEEDETAAYNAKLKANEVKEAHEDVVKGFNALNAQLTEMQKDHIKDKILRSNSSNDSKS